MKKGTYKMSITRYHELREKAQYKPLTNAEEKEIELLSEELNINPCHHCEGIGEHYNGDYYKICIRCNGEGVTYDND
jgi:hypothetical protein